MLDTEVFIVSVDVCHGESISSNPEQRVDFPGEKTYTVRMQADHETSIEIVSSDPGLTQIMDRFISSINVGKCGFRLRLQATGMEEGPIIDTKDFQVEAEKLVNENLVLFSPFKKGKT
jgi:hypothetical protein